MYNGSVVNNSSGFDYRYDGGGVYNRYGFNNRNGFDYGYNGGMVYSHNGWRVGLDGAVVRDAVGHHGSSDVAGSGWGVSEESSKSQLKKILVPKSRIGFCDLPIWTFWIVWWLGWWVVGFYTRWDLNEPIWFASTLAESMLVLSRGERNCGGLTYFPIFFLNKKLRSYFLESF